MSTSELFKTLAGGADTAIPDTTVPCWVDVHNLAASIFAAVSERHSGRYVLCDGEYDFVKINRIAHELRPDLSVAPRVRPEGSTPSEGGQYTWMDRKRNMALV